MKHAIALTLLLASAVPAGAETCQAGGVAGLSQIARRLHVAPTAPSLSALNGCDGRAYDAGALLAAMLNRLELLEARTRKLEGRR